MLGETPAGNGGHAGAALLMTTPKSVFLPVFILMFGIGFAEKIIFAVALTFFIVVPTGLAAAKSVPRGLVMVAQASGATRRQIIHAHLCARGRAADRQRPAARAHLRRPRHRLCRDVCLLRRNRAAHHGLGRSFSDAALLATVLLVLIATVAVNETDAADRSPCPRAAAPGRIGVSSQLIAVRNVSQIFGAPPEEFCAFATCRSAMEEGEFVCVVGPSGCGKSTLLQIIAGLRRRDQRRNPDRWGAITSPRPDKIGVVFQESLLLPVEDGGGDIEFPLALAGAAANAAASCRLCSTWSAS